MFLSSISLTSSLPVSLSQIDSESGDELWISLVFLYRFTRPISWPVQSVSLSLFLPLSTSVLAAFVSYLAYLSMNALNLFAFFHYRCQLIQQIVENTNATRKCLKLVSIIHVEQGQNGRNALSNCHDMVTSTFFRCKLKMYPSLTRR